MLTITVEGVIVVKKDTRMPKHAEIAVPNLEVMNLMKSMKSRGLVTEQFSWQHHYYFLTDEGLLFLRNYLHLPESVVPNTIAKAQRSGAARRSGTDMILRLLDY
jgi:small subunit ribosomal protein S10e